MKLRLVFICFFLTSYIFAQGEWTSEDILVTNDSIQLPGTLTYDTAVNKQPLIIFVPGSGNPDRNGNQPQFSVNGNYIKQFNDALNAEGIALFRYDKRNVTASNLKHLLEHFEFNDLVTDVTAIIDKFKEDNRFSSICLVGHSQGSLVAMLAVNEHVDKYVSLAGLSETADKTIIRQIKAQSEALSKVAASHIDELKNTGTIAEVNPMLVTLFAKPNQPFLSSYFNNDPTDIIKTLKVPILIINGTKDLQVTEEDARNLHRSQPNSKLVLIENMNHVLKTIEKDEDNLASYSSPDYELSEELVSTIAEFIKQ